MYEETIRFFADLFRNDGSILTILDADHTFLNESLARHYNIPNVSGDHWRRVEGVKQYSRGGILTHASALARQSGASRTSPILRGTWVVETLLGDSIPSPPQGVPELPDDNGSRQGLTMRHLVEKHTSVAACAKCHAHIDPYGFALERYDAIGRWRDTVHDGQSSDTHATLIDGTAIDGAEELRRYLLQTRRDDFVRHFCRKLLGFALGRGVHLSDEPLLDEMMQRLERSNYRFSAAVEAVVLSKQFRMIRGNGFGAN